MGKESTAFMQLPGKEDGQLMLERPRLPDGFQGKGFQSSVREGAAVRELSLFLALGLIDSR